MNQFIIEALTTYRYHTEFVLMFGGLAILAFGIWLDKFAEGKFWLFFISYLIVVFGAILALGGFVLCLASIFVNGGN